MASITETFVARDRKAWRAWLKRHHGDRAELWLVFFRKGTGERCVTYDEAVEEALCYGWVDGLKKKVDEASYAYRFSPRKPGSRWSATNRARAERLLAERRMAPAGLAVVEAARADGTFGAQAPRDVSMPPALEAALAKDPAARVAFEALPPSHRRQWQLWINEAKREETRHRRVARAVEDVREGRRPIL